MQEVNPIILEVRGLSIAFAGQDVVSDVDFSMRAGEIHAITGENGAGKSSLAKAIAGVYQPRLGSISIAGRPVRFSNPRQALAAGVALIHQEPQIFPDLSVAENIFAGRFPRKGGRIDWQACYRKTTELLEQLGATLDPKAPIDRLSVAQKQLVELASALAHGAKAWIFDETTAPLSPKEVGELFGVMRGLRDSGCAIAIVTHHLHEVFEIADRITALRDGRKTAETLTSETTPQDVVRLMVGRELETESLHGDSVGACALETTRLSGHGFQAIDLTLRVGEVVGIAGLVGSGRTELVESIIGARPVTQGQIKVFGAPTTISSPAAAIRAGIAFVSEDRIGAGLFMPQSIEFNATAASLDRQSRYGWLDKRQLTASTEKAVGELSLAYRTATQPVSELSGGNQQKVALAKALLCDPRILIIDEPTRGVDVGAKRQFHQILRDLTKSGMAVLMVSSDLKELLTLSDRIYVMRQGVLVAEFGSGATEEALLRAATGQVTVG